MHFMRTNASEGHLVDHAIPGEAALKKLDQFWVFSRINFAIFRTPVSGLSH
jgi:hypothetical protein